MKRTALRRRTRLTSTAWLRRRTPLRITGRASRRRAERDGLTDAEWAAAVKSRDRYICQARIPDVCHYIARRPHRVEAHHLKPRSVGGRNTLDNGLTVCAPNGCHDWIGNHPAEARDRKLLRHSWDD